jgi:ketosteroid isomerase-like protein
MFAAPGMRMEGSVLWVLEKQGDGTWLIDTECYNLDHPGDVPSPETDQIVAEVEAATEEWWAVWSAAEDFDRFMTFIADDPDVLWIADAVPHFGKDDIDTTFRPVMDNMQRQDNSPVEWRTIVVAPDVAYTVRINDVAQIDNAGNLGLTGRYAETLLWVNRNGEWKVLSGHGSAPNDGMG